MKSERSKKWKANSKKLIIKTVKLILKYLKNKKINKLKHLKQTEYLLLKLEGKKWIFNAKFRLWREKSRISRTCYEKYYPISILNWFLPWNNSISKDSMAIYYHILRLPLKLVLPTNWLESQSYVHC